MESQISAAASSQPALSRTIRVLHVVACSQRRGAELAALELADELAQLGYRNRVVALSPAFDGGHEPGLVPLGELRGESSRELVSGAWKLWRLLADDPVDVVVAHGGWPAQVVALAARPRGPLLVWQRILGLPDKVWGPVRRRWWWIVARRFDAAVVLTDDQAAELRRLGFPKLVWLIPNFRKTDRFRDLDRATAAAQLRTEVGVLDGTPLVGFIGHLVRQKRPERALEVLAQLRAQGCRAHLVVAGGGPLRAEMEARADHLGVREWVSFLGHRDDIELVLGGVDLALLTSEAEGIPGVAIEALMAGCPMVTVPVGGVAEVVEHGITGLVLDRDDPALMARAVVRLLADDATRTAMSRASRLHTDRFSAAAAAAVYAERITAALARR
jgi:glycosyltransferase involved in cell wall biosynthesis